MRKKETNPLVGKVIAIDGPAGAGKGTLSTSLAREYRMKYLDTGTLYRTVAYKVLQAGGDPGKEEDALKGCHLSDYDFKHIGDNQFRVFLDGQDVMAELRSLKVGQGASKVAFFTSVRSALKDFQVEFSKKWAAEYGVILDGRDIGTVICPDADFKFFIDADPEERAKRRIEELHARGYEASFEETLSEILERDARDRGRKDAPLKPAKDAYMVDSSDKNALQVLEMVMKYISIPAAKV
jgi:cytidylate kinase